MDEAYLPAPLPLPIPLRDPFKLQITTTHFGAGLEALNESKYS
jgi:hypothetical protein